MMQETLIHAEQDAYEVDLSYTPTDIQHKIAEHALHELDVIKKIKIHHQLLNRWVETDSAHLSPIQAVLSAWQTGGSLATLTAQLNQFCYAWLNASQTGISIHMLLQSVQCFSIQGMHPYKTAQLRLLLCGLLMESNQRYQNAQLEYLQHYDANTMLPNSSLLPEKIETLVAANITCGLLSIQFQPVKHIQIFSTEETLQLNQSITYVLQENIPKESTLYLNGNLRFDLLCPLENPSTINIIAAKLARAFEEMIFWGAQSILVMPYFGTYFIQTETAETCISNAKLALESAIATQQYLVTYSDILKQQVAAQNQLETQVLQAFASDNLSLYLQPLVDTKNNTCVGAELLLRTPTLASYAIYPSQTIEILNKVGKGKLFTRWLINSACRFASELKYQHKLNIYLTLNLRAEDLYDSELPLLLSQALALWRASAKDIVLEITESGILEMNESSQSVINTLHQNGFKLALDDFGTGFSSLSRLRTMPIDLIKIDQSFVRNIARSEEDFKIVRSIAYLADSLGKDVLAEGVEDEECLALIKKLKIRKCQGYYFAKPMSFENFILWVNQQPLL